MAENNQLNEQELKIVQELFGGLRNIGRAAGQAVNTGIQKAGQAVNTGIQKAGQAGRAVAAGAQQVGQNVSQMYQAGETERAAQQQVETLNKLLTQIQQVIAQVKQTNPQLGNLIGKNPRLDYLQQKVSQVAKAAANKATTVRNKGFTGGVGQAATQAYNTPNP